MRRGLDPGKARRLLIEARSAPRLVVRQPAWRRPEWWERERRKEALIVLVPVLVDAIRLLLHVMKQSG